MRFVDDPVEVDVRVGTDGDVHPLAFTWRGQRYPVTGLGRTSTQGDKRYFLVMTPGDRVFELCWHVPDNRWLLTRAPEDRVVV